MTTQETYDDDYTVTEIAALGYGNPDSSISYDKQLKSGELL